MQRSDVYVLLGRGEMRAGRSLESLLSAYRAGARVAWRRFAGGGRRARASSPATLYLLAESIFAYIDVLSAESAEGHALEQSAAASEAELPPPAAGAAARARPAGRPRRCRGRGGQRGRLAAAADAGRAGHRRRAA